ncbi:MAG: DUF2027 domain-containing protein [Bacteroidales bacterium]|jgi:hypothetical protein|nr:DUF2027 domain-containing protein [Bacteroidales bacterium]NPV36116.1 DUF2027 domain-containing protein [Bacteroidales bacterium]
MSLQPGDKVKFLNQQGGGTIVRIIKPGLVAVLIDDGFEIPTPESELVKIGGESAAARYFSETSHEKPRASENSTSKPQKPDSSGHLTESYVEALPTSARGSSNVPGIYLAFEPLDQKWLISGSLELTLSNLSDYDVIYTLFHKTPGGGYTGRDYGNIPPMHKAIIDVIKREDLDYVADGIVELMFIKDKMPSVWLPSVAAFKIKSVRFTKEDNYKTYAFLNRKAFVYQLAEISRLKSASRLEEMEKYGEETMVVEKAEQIKPLSFIARHKTAPREAVVDLHAEAILEDHREVPPEELLNLQLAYFTRCMEAAIIDNYYKVIFIHGVGNGVLKKAIIERLREYPNVIWQQAPFARFGMGAIEVMIMRPSKASAEE